MNGNTDTEQDSIEDPVDGGTLRLSDEGIEMPDVLRGYQGQFEIKTPNITGQINTTAEGFPDADSLGPESVLAVYPEDGTYHPELSAGEMVIQTRGNPNTKYTIVDERTDEDGGAGDE